MNCSARTAAAFWTWLWGLAGLLLSVPITVCLVVMGKYVPQLEFFEVLLGDEPALEPYQQLYQRLLTSNRDEADMLLEGAMREHSLREVCDIAIVPALRLLEADVTRGALKPVRRRAVLDHFQQWVDELLDELQRDNARRVDVGHADRLHPGLLGSEHAERFTGHHFVGAGDLVGRMGQLHRDKHRLRQRRERQRGGHLGSGQ